MSVLIDERRRGLIRRAWMLTLEADLEALERKVRQVRRDCDRLLRAIELEREQS
jgi:hypothetical protein